MPPRGGFLEDEVHPEDSSRSLFEAFGFLPADETESNISKIFPRTGNTSNESITSDQLDDYDFDPSMLWSQLTEDDFMREDLSESLRSLFAVLYVAIIFVGLIGNLAVIFIICTGPKLRTVTNMFLVSLAASDLLIAGVNMPFQLKFHLQSEWTGGEALCKLSYYLQGAVIVASILTLTGIALDRYGKLFSTLLRHRNNINRIKFKITYYECDTVNKKQFGIAMRKIMEINTEDQLQYPHPIFEMIEGPSGSGSAVTPAQTEFTGFILCTSIRYYLPISLTNAHIFSRPHCAISSNK